MGVPPTHIPPITTAYPPCQTPALSCPTRAHDMRAKEREKDIIQHKPIPNWNRSCCGHWTQHPDTLNIYLISESLSWSLNENKRDWDKW
jgi:hypothetical protein